MRKWVGWGAVALALAMLLRAWEPAAALAQAKSLSAQGRVDIQGLEPAEALPLAEGHARLNLAAQAVPVLAALPTAKALHLTPAELTAAALAIFTISLAPGSDGVVTASTAVDPSATNRSLRRVSVDAEWRERLQAALGELQRLIALPANASTARAISARNAYLAGLAVHLSGDLRGAVGAFGKAIALDPEYSAAWTAHGEELIATGDRAGYADLNEAVSKAPTASAPLRARGAALWRRLRYAAAEDDLSHALAIDPSDSAAMRIRGEVRAALRDDDRAIADLRAAVRLQPADAAAQQALGTVLMRSGKYATALRTFNEAVSLDPESATAFNNRGNLHARLQEYDQALKDYDEAIRLDPSDAVALNNRGEVYRTQSDAGRAIRDYSEAIRIRPAYAAAYVNRAAAYQHEGRPDDAFKDLDYASRLIPDNPGLYISRAAAYASGGLPERACQDWKRACELGTDSVCDFLQRANPCASIAVAP